MQLAEHIFEEMSDEEKVDCFVNTMRLCDQVTNGYGLGEPYFFAIDNDALNALRRPNIYPARYVGLMLLFRIVVNRGIDFRILINPAIFYEFNGRRTPKNEGEYREVLGKIDRVILPTGLRGYTTGLDTFRKARSNIKSIKHDLRQISAALIKIKEADWALDPRQNGILVPLIFIARENCPDVKMKYFSHFQACRFLETVIESQIIHNKKNSRHIMKLLRDEGSVKKSKMLELKKKGLSGLGDLSLVALCDMQTQFHGDIGATLIAITFDARLEAILSAHSSLAVHSERINLGDEPEGEIERKLSDHFESVRKVEEMNEAAKSFRNQFIESLQEIGWFNETDSDQ